MDQIQRKLKLVSILIPVRNAELYIADTLESALNQTWANIEIIIVDDGSEDKSIEIIRSFSDPRISLIHGEHKGASFARNQAFKHAKGDYIQFLDADDLLSPEKIEQQMDRLLQVDRMSACSAPWVRFEKNPTDHTLESEPVWRNYDRPIEWLIDAWEGGGMMQTACWLVSRELVELTGDWCHWKAPNDDGEFFCRLLLNSSRIIFSPESLVYYRSGINESLSQNLHQEGVIGMLRCYLSYEQHTLGFEDSYRVRHALMRNYLSFIYQFYPDFPELLDQCRQKINDLGFEKPESVGGPRARLLTRMIGFENMLFLRNFLKGNPRVKNNGSSFQINRPKSLTITK